MLGEVMRAEDGFECFGGLQEKIDIKIFEDINIRISIAHIVKKITKVIKPRDG